MSAPRVYVLVINWNGMEHVHDCFASLLASDYPNARFILLDNASEDGSPEYVERTFGDDPRVETLRLPENLGWSRGNNVGIRRAMAEGADYVFLLNNDTWTAPDAIRLLVEAAERSPRIGGLAPKMTLFYAPDVLNSVGLACSYIGCSWDIGLGRLDAPRWNAESPVLGACGGAAFFRRAALEKSGLLPEDFEIYLDDLDLCMRVWDAGYEMHACPQAVVRHKFSATMGEGARARRKYYLNTRNRFRVILRNYPLRRMLAAAPAVVVGEGRAIGRALLDGEAWRVGAHMRAWGAAAAYWRAAWRERRARRRRGLALGRFWPFITYDRMFFQGAPLPSAGWYAPRIVGGVEARPFALRASHATARGRLRVTLFNCYPQLGAADVVVSQNGAEIARLRTDAKASADLDVQEGSLEFAAERVFFAEETGEKADYGGWIAIE